MFVVSHQSATGDTRENLDFAVFRQNCVLMFMGVSGFIQALKESEMDTVPEEWQRAQCTHEYINCFFVRYMNQAEPMPTNTNQNPLDINEKVFLSQWLSRREPTGL